MPIAMGARSSVQVITVLQMFFYAAGLSSLPVQTFIVTDKGETSGSDGKRRRFSEFEEPQDLMASDQDSRVGLAMRMVSRIHDRFHDIDIDSDSVLTLEELRQQFHLGRKVVQQDTVLQKMLASCAGSTLVCNRTQFMHSLTTWISTGIAQNTFKEIASPNAGFAEVEDSRVGEPCGAAPRVNCTRTSNSCWSSPDIMAAWALNEVCVEGGCICEPDDDAKRLTKLGLAGVLAVSTSAGLWREKDIPDAPPCGSDWETIPIVAPLNLSAAPLTKGDFDNLEESIVGMGYNGTKIEKGIDSAVIDYTEAVIYKSSNHMLEKGKPPQKVCMISWQGTRSFADMKMGWEADLANFTYKPANMSFETHHGTVLAYQSIRNELKKTFMKECCGYDFVADKVIISGHSLGGGFSQLLAADMILKEWGCKDKYSQPIRPADLALVLVSPGANALHLRTISEVFSCADEFRCLAGRVVTLGLKGDFVVLPGDGPEPIHPSRVTQMPCRGPPEKYPVGPEEHFLDADERRWWCHGLFEYWPAVEEHLVDRAGWGSTCNAECGQPDAVMQRYQVTVITGKPFDLVNKSSLRPSLLCNASTDWVPNREKCACPLQTCWDLTGWGCAA